MTTASILVTMTKAQRDQVKAVARTIGLTLGTFCADAILQAVDVAGGTGKLSMAGQVRAIYRKVCVKRVLSPNVAEAVDALVQLGEDEDTTRRKIEKLAKAMPGESAEVLIAAALKRE